MEAEIKFDSGLLICPKCGTNGMGVFRAWKSMIQYNYLEKPVTTYILYESVSNFIFFCPFSLSQDNFKNDSSNSKKKIKRIMKIV